MIERDYIIPLGISFERYMDLSDLEGEIWKPVVGYESYFLISNMGRLKTLKRPNAGVKIKVPKSNGNGYWIHDFCLDNKHKYKYIHRLVAEAFIPNPNNKPEVDHLNTNRSDNRLCNLKWVTHMENQFNRITIENVKECHDTYPVVQLTVLGEYMNRWKSASKAASYLKISLQEIYYSVNKEIYSVGGYLFMKEDDYLKNGVTLPVLKSASYSSITGLPAYRSVAVFLDEQLIDAFASEPCAAEFYNSNVSSIVTMCRRDATSKYDKTEMTMKYFKDLNDDERMKVRKILYNKRRVGK